MENSGRVSFYSFFGFSHLTFDFQQVDIILSCLLNWIKGAELVFTLGFKKLSHLSTEEVWQRKISWLINEKFSSLLMLSLVSDQLVSQTHIVS